MNMGKVFQRISKTLLICVFDKSFLNLSQSVRVSNVECNEKLVERSFEGRLAGRFVSNNILDLSKRKLSDAEISFLSKGLKFVPTQSFVDQAAIKQDLSL